MNPITVRRHPLKFYFLIFFLAIFCCALGGFILSVGFRAAARNEGGFITLDAFGLVFVLLGIFSIYKYYKNTPIIKADQFQVTFNDTEAYPWQELEKVEFTGKQPFRYLLTFQMEGMMLRFKNGTVKYLFDDLYADLAEVKSFIQQVAIEKKDTFSYDPVGIQTPSPAETFVAFKGNQFTSIRGITIWGMYAIVAVALISRPHYFDNINLPKFLLFFGAFCICWFYFFSLLLNYFMISEHYLVVRNHNLWWKKKTYHLSDIKEVAIETQGKMPNSLRIITNDYRSKLFPAGTLRDKHWRAFAVKMKSKGVAVRNDSPFLDLEKRDDIA